jgi:fatty-acyl-CoA synthase
VKTVAEMLVARANDEAVGAIGATGSWSWREVIEESSKRGALALRIGSGPGATRIEDGPRGEGATSGVHIGVLLPNVAEYLFWLSGAALIGATVVGINPTRRGDALGADVRLTRCSMIVTDEDGAELFSGVETGVDPERVLVVGTAKYEELLATCGDDRQAMSDVMARASEIPGEALFLLLFTSGTTGAPKAVRCTQGRLASIAEVAAAGYGYSAEDVCYCATPLFHGNALMALWGPAVSAGAAVALRPRFSASEFLSDVRRYGATKFNYVGKAIAYILSTREREDDAENTLKIGFGSEASPRDRKRFLERFGCYLIEGYGQSEGGAVLAPERGMPPGALGRPPAGVDLAVIDPETKLECVRARFDEFGRILNAGEATGEIVNRGGHGTFEGYYGNEDAESERTRRGWYWTGDLAYRDEDGFFYFAGRGGDWLRVDSENFAAGPIEALLSRHDDVAVVAVYPVPDTRSGDQVMAAIEMRPGTRFNPASFEAWMGEQPDMGTKWKPRYIRVVEKLPETATGKVTKVSLRGQGWISKDPVYWLPDPSAGGYRLLEPDDVARLDAELAEHGRSEMGATMHERSNR